MEEEKENVTLAELKRIGETSEVLAREIRMLSRSFKKMASSGLKKDAIVVLVKEICKLPKDDIKRVMDAFEIMENVFLDEQ